MPLMRTEQAPINEISGDVYFAMRSPSGSVVPCEVSRDSLIALPERNEGKPLTQVFAEKRDEIEAWASDTYDLHGPDETGVVRLEPIIT